MSMTQNHSGFFFFFLTTIPLCCALRFSSAGHDYSKFSPTCTRNRGFPPKTQLEDTWPYMLSPRHVNCAASTPRDAEYAQEHQQTPPQRNPFFIFLLAPNLTSTLKPLLINFLYVCISARSKGPWDRGCAVQVPYVIFGWPHNAPHSQLLKTGTDSSSPCFPMYFRRQIKRSPR